MVLRVDSMPSGTRQRMLVTYAKITNKTQILRVHGGGSTIYRCRKWARLLSNQRSCFFCSFSSPPLTLSFSLLFLAFYIRVWNERAALTD